MAPPKNKERKIPRFDMEENQETQLVHKKKDKLITSCKTTKRKRQTYSWRAQERKGRKEERPARQLPQMKGIEEIVS